MTDENTEIEDLEDKAEDMTVEGVLAASGLSEKRQSFVREYMVDSNGTQAAIRAGYSKKTANPQAARLLANVSIQVSIHQIKTARAKALKFGKDDVIGFHVSVVRDPNESTKVKQKSAEALQRIFAMNDDSVRLAGDEKKQHEEWLDQLDEGEEE